MGEVRWRQKSLARVRVYSTIMFFQYSIPRYIIFFNNVALTSLFDSYVENIFLYVGGELRSRGFVRRFTSKISRWTHVSLLTFPTQQKLTSDDPSNKDHSSGTTPSPTNCPLLPRTAAYIERTVRNDDDI